MLLLDIPWLHVVALLCLSHSSFFSAPLTLSLLSPPRHFISSNLTLELCLRQDFEGALCSY